MNGPQRTFRAVSIEPDPIGCCQAAKNEIGRRYLGQEAPQLPLEDCTMHQDCRCKYQHWDDRRQEDRRALKSGIANQYFSGTDKRTGKERRS